MKIQDVLNTVLNKPFADENKVNPNELQMGIKVEMEHTNDKEVAKRIALHHLKELPDYYTRLEIMEKK